MPCIMWNMLCNVNTCILSYIYRNKQIQKSSYVVPSVV